MPANGDDLTGALRDLDALAVQEQFLAEWHAGRRPRLSEYVRRYPAHAAALAALVADLPPDSARAVADDGAVATAGATSTDSFPGRRWQGDLQDGVQGDLDTGVGRALTTLFGAAAGHKSLTLDAHEQPLAQVAETPTAYRPGKPAEPEPPTPPAPPEPNVRD